MKKPDLKAIFTDILEHLPSSEPKAAEEHLKLPGDRKDAPPEGPPEAPEEAAEARQRVVILILEPKSPEEPTDA